MNDHPGKTTLRELLELTATVAVSYSALNKFYKNE